MAQPFSASPAFFRALLEAIKDWEPQDREIILEGRIEGFGVDSYYRNSASNAVDPYEWVEALDREKKQRAAYYKALSDKHGFPATDDMPPEQAHIMRLSYLLTKYPHADWSLLLDGAVRVSGDTEKTSRIIPLRRETAAELETPQDVAVAPVDTFPATVPPTVPQTVPENVPESAPAIVPQGETTSSAEPVEVGPTMTAHQVAQRTGLAYATVIRFLKTGELPYGKKLGTKWTVPTAPFLEWLEGSSDEVRSLAEPKPRQGGKPLKKEPAQQPEIRHGWSAPF